MLEAAFAGVMDEEARIALAMEVAAVVLAAEEVGMAVAVALAGGVKVGLVVEIAVNGAAVELKEAVVAVMVLAEPLAAGSGSCCGGVGCSQCVSCKQYQV